MAPIPKDNRDKSPNGNKDDSEIGHFSNPNLAFPLEGGSDSSDDDREDNFGATTGYSLLPQEPADEDYNDDDYESSPFSEIPSSVSQYPLASGEILTVAGESGSHDLLPETVLASEAGASAPTVSLSNELCHPAFLAKFPEGKVPSYMQVPNISKDKDIHLWNQQRQDKQKMAMDAAHESNILKAMAGFSLPTESIPEWARNLPDDQWQQQVLKHIGKNEGHSDNMKTEKSANIEESTSNNNNNWVAEFSEADNVQ